MYKNAYKNCVMCTPLNTLLDERDRTQEHFATYKDQQSVMGLSKNTKPCCKRARNLLLSVWEIEINNWIKHEAKLLLLALLSVPFWRQELVDMGIPQSIHFLHHGR